MVASYFYQCTCGYKNSDEYEKFMGVSASRRKELNGDKINYSIEMMEENKKEEWFTIKFDSDLAPPDDSYKYARNIDECHYIAEEYLKELKRKEETRIDSMMDVVYSDDNVRVDTFTVKYCYAKNCQEQPCKNWLPAS